MVHIYKRSGLYRTHQASRGHESSPGSIKNAVLSGRGSPLQPIHNSSINELLLEKVDIHTTNSDSYYVTVKSVRAQEMVVAMESGVLHVIGDSVNQCGLRQRCFERTVCLPHDANCNQALVLQNDSGILSICVPRVVADCARVPMLPVAAMAAVR